jgi:hypothetical protein
MAPVKIILVVLGFLCEVLAIYVPSVAPRVNLVAAGLACWFASILFP